LHVNVTPFVDTKYNLKIVKALKRQVRMNEVMERPSLSFCKRDDRQTHD